jgi:hypothetical protein
MLNENKTNGFEYWVRLKEIEKIKQYIQKLGFIRLSSTSSTNQIYKKNGNMININERLKQ